MGRSGDGRAGPDPGTVREGAAPGGRTDRGLPARDHRDGEPDAHTRRRRSRGRAVRFEPALDPGRRGGGPVRGPRPARLRGQGRGQRDLLPASERRPRLPPAAHHGRRLRPGDGAPQGAAAAADGAHGRDRGDHDGGHPPPGDGGGRGARLPDRGGERRRHQAPVRQSLRDRPVHDRRDHPGHEPAARGADGGRVRLRAVRTRRGVAGPRDGSAGGHHRGRPDAGAGGGDGGLRGHADPRGGSDRRGVRDRHGRHRGPGP